MCEINLDWRPLALRTLLESAQVPVDQPLMEAGLDSLGALDLRNATAAHFAVDLPATLVIDYPTLNALALYISGLMAVSSAPEAAPLQHQEMVSTVDFIR